jgi:hypothetical protein
MDSTSMATKAPINAKPTSSSTAGQSRGTHRPRTWDKPSGPHTRGDAQAIPAFPEIAERPAVSGKHWIVGRCSRYALRQQSMHGGGHGYKPTFAVFRRTHVQRYGALLEINVAHAQPGQFTQSTGSLGSASPYCTSAWVADSSFARTIAAARRWRRHELKYVGLIFHDLRRSGVRNMVRGGISEDVAMKISGHKTRKIFSRYNITSERDLQDATRKMEARRKAASPDFGHDFGHDSPGTASGGGQRIN